jgi:prepilin-type N-terminal cleavage/methylation domain-containing protein
MFRRLSISSPSSQRPLRQAFTLVEMLVAVALVLLMMSLFSEIFSLAIGSMSRQKGVAENDQRARMILTVLKGDLEKRTFRDVVPFQPGMSTDLPYFNSRLNQRRGYLSYSENNPNSLTDDVLRLTIDVTQVSQNEDVTPLYGRAVPIGTVSGNVNQPESDNGRFDAGDNTGMSDWAEVVYFMRGSRLYRRQMLIRKPYIPDTLPDPTTGNPATTNPLFSASYPGVFWRDFDYSAFYDSGSNRTRFHGLDSLSNAGSAPSSINSGVFSNPVPLSLGIPHFRFGHSLFVGSGIPKEFTGANDLGTFIGNFTHEETSFEGAPSKPAFVHPGQATVIGINPFSRTDLTLDSATLAVSQYSNNSQSPRTGEDLLLSNVLSFDIKIWDPGVSLGVDGFKGHSLNKPYSTLTDGDDDGDGVVDNDVERGWPNSDDGDWRDLGHAEPQGFYYRLTSDKNGNATSYGNRFDTWHPNSSLDSPPYRAMLYYPSGSTGAANHPWRVPNRGTWGSTTSYSVGDVVFAPIAPLQGYSFVYRCRSTSFTSQSGAIAPVAWPTEPGQTIADGNVNWECVENTIPVKGLQFKIRYLDISSGLVRDLTFVQYLSVPN